MRLLTIILAFATIQIGFSQETDKITFYGKTIRASDVLPQGKKFGPALTGNERKTETISPAPVAGSSFEFLGSIYTATNFSGFPTEFMNVSYPDVDVPILDSINVRWYSDIGLGKIRPKYLSDPKFAVVQTVLKDAKLTVKQKKEKLLENSEIYSALEAAKYRVIMSSNLTIKEDIKKAFKIGIGTEIEAKVAKLVKADVNLKAKIDRVIETNFELTGGIYSEVTLEESYVKVASSIFKYWLANKDKLAQQQDIYFAPTLLEFFKSADQAVVSKAAVLQATFNKTKLKNIETELNALVKANLDTKLNLSVAQVDKATAEIGAKFYKKKDGDIELSTAEAYYYIRFVRNSLLELGVGGE